MSRLQRCDRNTISSDTQPGGVCFSYGYSTLGTNFLGYLHPPHITKSYIGVYTYQRKIIPPREYEKLRKFITPVSCGVVMILF